MGRSSDYDHQATLKKHGMGKYEQLSFGREHLFFSCPFFLRRKKNAILEVHTEYFFQDSEQGAICKEHSENPFHAVIISCRLMMTFKYYSATIKNILILCIKNH